MKSKLLIHLFQDNIVDLLDPTAGQAVLSKRPKLKARRPKEGSTGGFEVDENTGRIIITDPDEQKKEKEKKGSSSKLWRIIFWVSHHCDYNFLCSCICYMLYFYTVSIFFLFSFFIF